MMRGIFLWCWAGITLVLNSGSVAFSGESDPSDKDDSWSLRAPVNGVATGIAVGLTCNPLDKLKTCLQVSHRSGGELSFIRALAQNPFRGTITSVAHGVSGNLLIFGTMPVFRTGLSEAGMNGDHPAYEGLAGAMAGSFRSLVMGPVGTVRTRQFVSKGSEPAWQIIRDIPKGQRLRTLMKGAPACSLENAGMWGPYFAMTHLLQKQINRENHPVVSFAIGGPALLLSSAVGYPFDTVSNVQRRSGTSRNMWETAKGLYRQGGTARFYRGFWSGVALRMFVSGAVIQSVLSGLDRAELCFFENMQ